MDCGLREVVGRLGGVHLTEGDGDALGRHARDAMLGNVGAVPVQDQDRAAGWARQW